MGHTVYPMRFVIYNKINQLKKLSKGLREPDKSIAEEIIESIYQNISAISFACPLPKEIETNMVFCLLLQEKKNNNLFIDDLTLLLLSIMVYYKEKKLDESNIHRLLFERE